MNRSTLIQYQINQRDEISSVNARWTEFALENDAPQLESKNVVGRKLWDFINDDATVYLYQQLIRRAREGESVHFTLRCDAPDVRRGLDIRIEILPDGDVSFESRVTTETQRDSIDLLDVNVQRSEEIVVACSWCNKVEVSEDNWQEVEDAVKEMELFETENIPQISHGMCGACFKTISAIASPAGNGP